MVRRVMEQIRIRASLYRLRKNSGFDFALKGRGFSRAVSLAKSKAALAADAPSSYQDDFFRSRFSDAENGSRFVSGHRFSDAVNAALRTRLQALRPEIQVSLQAVRADLHLN